MAIFYPDILEHNNSAKALADITQFRGTSYPIVALADTSSIPTDKRNTGALVFVSSTQDFYGFYGQTAGLVDWDTSSNWRAIATQTWVSTNYAPISHTHPYDNYQSWNLKTNGIQRTTVTSNGTLDLVAGSNVSLSYGAGGVVTISSTDTNTIYTHPSYTARNITATGATVLSTFTSDTIGSVTGITTRTLTLANLGYTGATNANYITNNNQLTNGAGYITGVTNITGYSGNLISEDNRIISPSELAANRLKFGFTSWANNNSSPYADFIHLRSYQDASGGNDNLIMFKKSSIGMRIWQQAWGSSTAYASYADVWTTLDFTSTDVSNWNTAYGWGNHASAGYLTSYTDTNTTYTAGTSLTLSGTTFSVTSNGISATQLNVSGNGTTSQYLRSDGDGTFSWVTPPDTNTTYSIGNGGLTEINFTSALNTKLAGIATNANNYVLPFTNNSSNWNTAYSWGNHASAGYATTASPLAPSVTAANIIGETIEVVFNASTTTGIDYYQVWSSVAGGPYGLIAQIPDTDFAPTMTVVDSSFSISGTVSYRVYAVKSGVYSTPGTRSAVYASPALDIVNMSVINLNTAYYIQYDLPTTRFLDHIEIWMDSQTTTGALNRVNAVLIYSGQNTSYMRNVNTSNNFHQFWVELITS